VLGVLAGDTGAVAGVVQTEAAGATSVDAPGLGVGEAQGHPDRKIADAGRR